MVAQYTSLAQESATWQYQRMSCRNIKQHNSRPPRGAAASVRCSPALSGSSGPACGRSLDGPNSGAAPLHATLAAAYRSRSSAWTCRCARARMTPRRACFLGSEARSA